jgi:hypothetical protein
MDAYVYNDIMLLFTSPCGYLFLVRNKNSDVWMVERWHFFGLVIIFICYFMFEWDFFFRNIKLVIVFTNPLFHPSKRF